MAEADATSFSLDELNAFLWKASSRLRGYVSAENFKDYILPLVFYKWISDTWDMERAAAIADHGPDVEPEVEAGYHRFIVPDGCHWADLKASSRVGYTLQNCLRGLAAANIKRLSEIFYEWERAEYESLPDEIIFDLLYSLDQLTLNSSAVSQELLGVSYENMIRQFADAAGKKGGEFVTPQSVVRLLTRILDPQAGETVYDPACGTAGLLIGAVDELRETGRDSRTLRLYGQELNAATAVIARMNLIIHGLEDFRVVQGDTLRDPRFLDQSQLQKFDVAMASPPFSLKNWGAERWVGDPYGRSFCGIPPASTADFAWVEHVIASMNRDTGRAGVIMPHGVLFRSGAEKLIRECLIERDCLEAVIGLPPSLFYSTSVPTCLLVFKARKPSERRGLIVFIDAAACYTKDRKRNQIDSVNVDRIVAAYRYGTSEEIPTRLVGNAEISESDWDLEVSRYLKVTGPGSDVTTPVLPISQSESSATGAELPHLRTQELSKSCVVLTGRNRIAKGEDEDAEFRVIQASDIRSGLTPWSDLARSNRRKATSVEVTPGDIIGSISGPYGRWIVVPDDYGPALASDHTVVLKGRDDVSMWFILGFLRSPRGKELIEKTQRGTVISRISPTELKRIPVPECPLPPEYVDPVLRGFEEEHERLEGGIEELYNRFTVVYESESPVEVSARLDALQGITASMREMVGLGEILTIARNSYPYPIARNLHAIGNTLSLRERYHEVVHEAPEILSVLLACVCAAVARETAMRGGQATRRWASATAHSGATIGTRNAMILEVAKNLMTLDGSEDIGGLGRALGDSSAPAVILMQSLLAERNRIHGDYPRSEIQFQQRLAESEDDEQRLLEALGFLARWEFRYAEFVEPLEGEDHSTFFSATFRVLKGDNPDWELATYTSQSPLYRGRVYAFVDDQHLIDLYPFLLVLPCQACSAAEVYHPASFTDDEVYLKSIDRGHSQTSSDARLLAAVRAAFA